MSFINNINLKFWYILPKSNLINGNILRNGIYEFIQERIQIIEEFNDFYIFNKKYKLEKDGIDSFFKEPQRLKIQNEFIKLKLNECKTFKYLSS